MRVEKAGRSPGGEPQRLQKYLSQLGVATRREAEAWIRAGRLTVDGRPALLGMRVTGAEQLQLDGRSIRLRAGTPGTVLLCHRSPGEPLLPGHPGARSAQTGSLASRLPRRAGHRWVSISPMPTGDGGLELLSADGALAARLQRSVRMLEAEYAVRVRGQLSAPQLQALRSASTGQGAPVTVLRLEAGGGEGHNRWYRLVTAGASGRAVRALCEQHAIAVVRVLRTRLGALGLPRTLSRGSWRELSAAELDTLLRAAQRPQA